MRALSVLVLAALASMAVAEDKPVLLTANGASNPKYSEYKKAAIVELTGAGYYATPLMYGEKGTAEALIPFNKGCLTNGDSSSAWKRQPGPYTYWTGKKQGEIFLVFGTPCRIRRIRLALLFSKTSGSSEIQVFAKSAAGGQQEAPPLAKIGKPQAGWNEIKDLDVATDGLRFLFKVVPGKTYIHVNEIEVWGNPVPQKAPAGG